MTNSALEEIINITYAIDDLHYRIALLKEFFEFKFFSEHKDFSKQALLQEFLTEREEVEDVVKMLHELSEHFYETFTRENFYTLLDEVTASTQTIPLLTLYIPIVLPPEEIRKLGVWARENVKEKILLKISVDNDAIGGCVLVWGGKYYDFSFRHFFKQHQKDIVTMINQYGEK